MGRKRNTDGPRGTSAQKAVQGQATSPGRRGLLGLPENGVDIDGSILEGGGQILRISAALSAITKTPIRVKNIRANRSRPGLQPQHLAGLQLVARICNGDLQGAAVGSSTITLVPGQLQSGVYNADPGTAASCCLLAQAAVPVLLFAGRQSDGGSSTLDLRGGTDAKLAPPVDYLRHVFIPTMQRLWGISIDVKLGSRGFYPRGGGSLSLSIPALMGGSSLQPVHLTNRGEISSITIRSFSAGKLPVSIAERMAAAAQAIMKQGLPKRPSIAREMMHCTSETQPAAFGDGAGILITAETSGGCILGAGAPGERGVTAEDIGTRAATELLEDLAHRGCLDRWMEDQVIIFMTLSRPEQSVVTCGEPSLHTRTAMTIAEKLTSAKFKVIAPCNGEKHYTIACTGLG